LEVVHAEDDCIFRGPAEGDAGGALLLLSVVGAAESDWCGLGIIRNAGLVSLLVLSVCGVLLLTLWIGCVFVLLVGVGLLSGGGTGRARVLGAR
jgi:hypothetical protein